LYDVDEECLVFGVWCLVFGVWCLVLSPHPQPLPQKVKGAYPFCKNYNQESIINHQE
jgi:hypothetical protein